MEPIPEIADLLPDSSRRTADLAARLVVRNKALFGEMLCLALEENGRMSMRAARVVALASESRPDLSAPHVYHISRRLIHLQHSGVKRGLLKTLLERPFDYSEETLGFLVQACFKFFNDPSEEVAIKVYALDLLNHSVTVYPELREELIASIDVAYPQFSTAMKTRSLKIRNALIKATQG